MPYVRRSSRAMSLAYLDGFSDRLTRKDIRRYLTLCDLPVNRSLAGFESETEETSVISSGNDTSDRSFRFSSSDSDDARDAPISSKWTFVRTIRGSVKQTCDVSRCLEL